MGCWTRATPAMMCLLTALINRPRSRSKLRASGYNSRIHRRGRRNHPLTFSANASEPSQEPDTRSHRARHPTAPERVLLRSEHMVRTIGIVWARAKIGLQQLAYTFAAWCARTSPRHEDVKSSAVFQPKQWAEQEAGRQSKTGPNPNLCPIRRQIERCSRCLMIDTTTQRNICPQL